MLRYSALYLGANSETVETIITAAIATGPTTRCFDDPSSAYNIIGSKQAYKPAWAGTPAKFQPLSQQPRLAEIY